MAMEESNAKGGVLGRKLQRRDPARVPESIRAFVLPMVVALSEAGSAWIRGRLR